MTATLIGELTLSAALPGFAASLDATGLALNNLKGVAEATVAGLNATANVDLAAEVASINAGVGASLQAQIDGGLTAKADLEAVSDAAAWLAGTVAELQAAATFLAGLDADVHLAGQIAAVDAGVSASVSAKASLDADLNVIADAQVTGLGELSAALDVAISAAVPGVVAYAELTSQLLSAGVITVHFTGQVQDFGADCDGAIAGSSLGATDNSTGIALLVSSSNPTTEANFKAVFGIS